MTVPTRQTTPPVPVIAAAAVIALGGLALAALLVGRSPLAAILSVALAGLLAAGLWRGNRAVQMATLLLAAFNVLTAFAAGGGETAGRLLLGAALLLLLLAPGSARAWFTRA